MPTIEELVARIAVLEREVRRPHHLTHEINGGDTTRLHVREAGVDPTGRYPTLNFLAPLTVAEDTTNQEYEIDVDVGTGATQVAQGDHTHAGGTTLIEKTITFTGAVGDENTNAVVFTATGGMILINHMAGLCTVTLVSADNNNISLAGGNVGTETTLIPVLGSTNFAADDPWGLDFDAQHGGYGLSPAGVVAGNELALAVTDIVLGTGDTIRIVTGAGASGITAGAMRISALYTAMTVGATLV